MKILVTGSAGFIGFHICQLLINENFSLIGIDNLNDYYDVNLKKARRKELEKLSNTKSNKYKFLKGDISNKEFVEQVFEKYKPEYVVNLAAQAGVRYSIKNPTAYVKSNLVGFSNIIESSKKIKVKHLIFASSSSVYGGNQLTPFKEEHAVDHPVSLYAATKRSNELVAHAYSHLYNMPCTGLRFFTVYGPWGRPDMALFLFTKSIISNNTINIFNNGQMIRDFTYIDDISESIKRLIFKIPKQNELHNLYNNNPSESWAPFKIFNIGNSNPSSLMDYIGALEKHLGKKAMKKYLPMQAGDMKITESDNRKLQDWIQFKPNTSIFDGVGKFVNWYKIFYKVNF